MTTSITAERTQWAARSPAPAALAMLDRGRTPRSRPLTIGPLIGVLPKFNPISAPR
jgi:hypothetical protein